MLLVQPPNGMFHIDDRTIHVFFVCANSVKTLLSYARFIYNRGVASFAHEEVLQDKCLKETLCVIHVAGLDARLCPIVNYVGFNLL